MSAIETQFLIVGAGPTGIGAAWRLTELARRQVIDPAITWLLTEQAPGPGGMAASVTDARGFVWDLGGHVIYSHYRYFDALLDELVGSELLQHERRGWVWMNGAFIPFPIQHNLRHLPAAHLSQCLNELLAKNGHGTNGFSPETFGDWMSHHFGETLCDIFFRPFNFKMWAYPADAMSANWTQRKSGSRYANVPMVNLSRLMDNVICQRDDPGWVGATTFPYPANGGTGLIWQRACERLPAERIAFGRKLVGLDPLARRAHFSGGLEVRYRYLVNSAPLPELLRMAPQVIGDTHASMPLKHTRSHLIGIGVAGRTPAALRDKCWIYVPEPDIPCFRMTVVSNYSPHNVPDEGEHWSVLCEVSESPQKPVDAGRIAAEVEQAFRQRFLPAGQQIVSTWHRRLDYGYPVPCLERDSFLAQADAALRRLDIRSRGRFGGWKYESSNQDNSFMQGVEAVDNLLFGAEELSYFYPDLLGEGAVDRRLPN